MYGAQTRFRSLWGVAGKTFKYSICGRDLSVVCPTARVLQPKIPRCTRTNNVLFIDKSYKSLRDNQLDSPNRRV